MRTSKKEFSSVIGLGISQFKLQQEAREPQEEMSLRKKEKEENDN